MQIRHWLQSLRSQFSPVYRNPEGPFCPRKRPGVPYPRSFPWRSPNLQFHRHAMARRVAARQSHWTARQRLA